MKISRKKVKAPETWIPTVKSIPTHKPHPTKKVVIKTAQIDKEMVPVVKWLNNFESVSTKWCCQGEDDTINNPYVVFSCDHPLELLTIVEEVGYTGVVEIRPPDGIRLMDYCIRFPNKANFKVFADGLNVRKVI